MSRYWRMDKNRPHHPSLKGVRVQRPVAFLVDLTRLLMNRITGQKARVGMHPQVRKLYSPMPQR